MFALSSIIMTNAIKVMSFFYKFLFVLAEGTMLLLSFPLLLYSIMRYPIQKQYLKVKDTCIEDVHYLLDLLSSQLYGYNKNKMFKLMDQNKYWSTTLRMFLGNRENLDEFINKVWYNRMQENFKISTKFYVNNKNKNINVSAR